MGLSQAWGSPNGAMRKGWNGITISRDTIHIKGMELGYKNIVLFERHAVGGEYSAGFKSVGKGTVKTVFHPAAGGDDVVVDERTLTNELNNVVVYDNPLDNVTDLAHIFFQRCLEHKVTPYVVTKKTVFKWQEGFWQKMKACFDENYKQKFIDAGLTAKTNNELQHLISDAATMQIIRWTDGGFGMAAHNYDGDMLTDEISQVHRSPGFITSNLTGKRSDGALIKEFEASHGTVADMWDAHLEGKETSLNPLGMVHALVGAIQHSVALQENKDEKLVAFCDQIIECMNVAMVNGKGTRDLVGPKGLTTEVFIDNVAKALNGDMSVLQKVVKEKAESPPIPGEIDMDTQSVRDLFDRIDTDGNGTIDFQEFTNGLLKLGIAPTTAQAQERKTKHKEEEEARAE